jgi:serine/threonine-protein kinase
LAERIGHYEVIRLIARGGMATLHLARAVDPGPFEQQVAVKRILPQLSDNHELVQRFLEEARLAATLHHPNIVEVFDLGAETNQTWFAMEYLHGEDVRRIMQELQHQQRALPLTHALSIALGACAGLEHAHRRGIVHRDVSPQNLLVTYEGGVKLLDFGIAKGRRAGDRPLDDRQGKVQYMSPEQCRGDTIDRRSDVFSLAIMLWEMTTGRRLYRSVSDIATVKMIVEKDAPAPRSFIPDYPEALERIVMKGLARDPASRWQSAAELERALEAFARERALDTGPGALSSFLNDLFSAAQPLPAGAEDTMETPTIDLDEPPPELLLAAAPPLPAALVAQTREDPRSTDRIAVAHPASHPRRSTPLVVAAGLVAVALLLLALLLH